MKKLIFLAAIENELNPLKDSLRRSDGIDGSETEFIELGVGVINSIITLGQQINRFSQKSRAVLVGTAGIFADDFVPGAVYQASVFRWDSLGSALNQGYLPGLLYPDISAPTVPSSSAEPEKIPVITTPEITSGKEGARALQKRHGRALENLEAYGIACLLKKHNIPLSGFFSVTNRVGKEGHQQYLDNKQSAWENLAEVVPRWLNCR